MTVFLFSFILLFIPIWHSHSVESWCYLQSAFTIFIRLFDTLYNYGWRAAPQEFPFTFLPKTHQPEHQFLLHFKENLLFTIPKYVFCIMPLHLYLCLQRIKCIVAGCLVLRENIFLILFLVFRRKYAHRNNDKRVSSSHSTHVAFTRHTMHCLFVLITDGKTYDPGTTAHAEKCIRKLRARTANVHCMNWNYLCIFRKATIKECIFCEYKC